MLELYNIIIYKSFGKERIRLKIRGEIEKKKKGKRDLIKLVYTLDVTRV
jgi:hypothetical protein